MSSDLAPKSNGAKANDRAKNIVKGMGWLTLQNLGTNVLGFVFLATLLRLLPAAEYGIYSAVLLVAGIAINFACFGLNLSAARYIALLREQDEQASWIAARKILYVSILFTSAVTAVYLGISPFLSIYFTKSPSWTFIFLLGGAYLFLGSISNISSGIIQGLKKYKQLAKILTVSRVVMVGFSIAVLEFVDRSVTFAIVAWLIYFVITITWMLIIINRNILRARGSFGYSNLLRYTFPLGIASIIATFSSNADQVIVGGYLTPVSLGVYNAAITISGALGLVFLTPLTTAFLPEASSSSSEQGNISNGLRIALRFVTLGVLPASLFVCGISLQLLSLFSGGGSYLAGVDPLELISSFYVFLAIQTVILVLLQAVGKTFHVMLVGVVAASTDICVALLLVPNLGIAGAALSKVSVALMGMFVALYLARRYLKGLDSPQFYFKGALCAAIPFATILILSNFVSARVVTLAPYSILYAVLFLLCVKTSKLLSKEDRAFLALILPSPIKRLVDYI
ncbi:MAG: oligosaccharide flippase family protein [Nitrososphaerales archaeon]